MKNSIYVLIATFCILTSCKKNSDNKPANSSRVLRYEVSGNFTGTLISSYTTASGGIANDQITLPWTKEITYASSVTAANIVITGNSGVAGQKVSVVIKRGGNQLGTPTEMVAESSGSFSEAAPVVVF